MMSQTTSTEHETSSETEAVKHCKAPWFVLFYLVTFVLLMEFNWKIGVAWACWRLGHSSSEAWKKSVQKKSMEKEQ